MKKFIIGLRTSIKAIILLIVGCIIVFTIAMCVYKPIYSVSLDGEMIGYSQDKATLQAKILNYIEKGDEDNVAFVQIDKMPEYKLCFLKRGIETNDDEIYEKVIANGITYYKYYALALNNEEKLYVSTFEEAEEVVSGLKEKNSNNVESLSIQEKYSTEKKEMTDKETAISNLYEEKKVVVATTNTSSGVVTKAKVGSGYKSIGISFIKPVTATITSRFGARWGTTHKGLDLGAKTGTSIKAAASGTVTFANWSGTYGYLVIISHGNGVQTYYAHCSSILTKVGATVSQGDIIAKVGSTGHTTGPHLHFEIRVNGVAYNPEYYI